MVDKPLWVFGYGSLLWDPGFTPVETQIARLDGYHRSFCMWSIHHRGSEEDPGLVLALDKSKGASCHGVALRVSDDETDAVLAALRERELISSAYYEDVVPLSGSDGRALSALTYIIDQNHRQYCGGLELERQAQVIAQATGGRGPNAEYLFNTVGHLSELDIIDPELVWLVQRVRNIQRASGG